MLMHGRVRNACCGVGGVKEVCERERGTKREVQRLGECEQRGAEERWLSKVYSCSLLTQPAFT